MKNARFWVFWNNDWAKVTLRPGQGVTMSSFQYTDEGFSRTTEDYYYNEHRNVIESTWHNESRDCDGPLERFGKYECNVADLNFNEGRNDEYGWCPSRPLWKKVSSRQRDHYAEAMGY